MCQAGNLCIELDPGLAFLFCHSKLHVLVFANVADLDALAERSEHFVFGSVDHLEELVTLFVLACRRFGSL